MFRWFSRHKTRRNLGPAIHALDSIDVWRQRKDGGVDLIIIDSDPANVSPETRRLLQQKIAGYLSAIQSESFQCEFNFPAPEQTRIIVTCQRTEPEACPVG
jgi:hypothetical protein